MNKFDKDFLRYDAQNKRGIRKWLCIHRDRMLRALCYARRAERAKGKLLSAYYAKKSRHLFHRNGVEIGSMKNIGGGICLVHPYAITINSRAHIGEDFTIFKGATVGSIRSGNKKGTPTIGNRVTVCANAFVCGSITVGDDVLIAANAFVNFDVPPNSVVLGNPGTIHAKENPSADYLPKTSL